MQTLADQAALVLGWTTSLIEPAEEIQRAVSNIFDLGSKLNGLCEAIHRRFALDFTAIQLILLEEKAIATVVGTGSGQGLSGLAKHYLEEDPPLRDIQADIVLENKVEVISGWDDRFDRWIFDEFHHERLLRVWLPL